MSDNSECLNESKGNSDRVKKIVIVTIAVCLVLAVIVEYIISYNIIQKSQA